MIDGAAIMTNEPGVGPVEMFPLEVSVDGLKRLLTEFFEEHSRHIVFGSLIQGAWFELTAEAPAALPACG